MRLNREGSAGDSRWPDGHSEGHHHQVNALSHQRATPDKVNIICCVRVNYRTLPFFATNSSIILRKLSNFTIISIMLFQLCCSNFIPFRLKSSKRLQRKNILVIYTRVFFSGEKEFNLKGPNEWQFWWHNICKEKRCLWDLMAWDISSASETSELVILDNYYCASIRSIPSATTVKWSCSHFLCNK